MPGPPASSTGERRVFVSYASEDAANALQIVDKLEAVGIRCWIAPRDIPPGASYPAAITAAIMSSGAVLLLLTDAANASRHVLTEVELAFNTQRPILPVRQTSVVPSPDLHYFISTTQWYDAGSVLDVGDVAPLEARLRELLDAPATRHVEPRPPRVRRHTIIAVASGVAAVAILIAVFVPARLRRASPTRPNDASAASRETPPAATPRGAILAEGPGGIKTRVNPLDGATYVWIPAGRFTMGCSSGDPACQSDEMPAHAARIRNGFWLGRTEVTAAQYRKRAPASDAGDKTADDAPASGMTWAEAKAYCAAVGGRLPSETEWEYAARAGSAERYYDSPSAVAWYEANSDERTHAVAGKAPNAFGLYDMLGNVAEWVRDRYYNAYDDSDAEAPVEEPLAPNASAVARGGGWVSDANGVRVSRRLAMEPDQAEPFVGVRCAHDKL